jgi:hypothetical protein
MLMIFFAKLDGWFNPFSSKGKLEHVFVRNHQKNLWKNFTSEFIGFIRKYEFAKKTLFGLNLFQHIWSDRSRTPARARGPLFELKVLRKVKSEKSNKTEKNRKKFIEES